MIASLPQGLSDAVEAEIAAIPARDLRTAAQALSQAYRSRAAIRSSLSPAERAAYLAVRFPSTFAVAEAVWREFTRAMPLTSVHTVLDVGAGPGTASLASAASMDPGARFTWIERDAGWRATAVRLAAAASIEADFRQAAIAPDMNHGVFDVAVASYALNELDPSDRAAAIANLWRDARAALIVIEPGTPAGFEIVRAARETILAQGGHAAAPCTHDARCPMSVNDWCHRPERVARSAAHRAAKQAPLGYEDEKFSFVILTREAPKRHAAGRIVRKPMRASGHVRFDLCAEGELRRVTVARSDREAYRDTRDANWGDLWPPQTD